MTEEGEEAALGWDLMGNRRHRWLPPRLQICAVLAAVTEVIRSQGGKESETEYFAALVSECSFPVRVGVAGSSGCRDKTGTPACRGGERRP